MVLVPENEESVISFFHFPNAKHIRKHSALTSSLSNNEEEQNYISCRNCSSSVSAAKLMSIRIASFY